jgi:hypothetical protein
MDLTEGCNLITNRREYIDDDDDDNDDDDDDDDDDDNNNNNINTVTKIITFIFLCSTL